MNDEKDFDGWNTFKQRIDGRSNVRTFQEREIFWVSVGINVGSEIYGKSHVYSRPVLVLKKFNPYRFLGAPLTSRCDNRPNRASIVFNEKEGRVIFDQVRVFDARRLLNKEAKIGKKQFSSIKQAYKTLI